MPTRFPDLPRPRALAAVAALAALSATAALAITPLAVEPPPRPDPGDPAAPVPPATYRSVFAAPAVAPSKPVPWAEANHTVRHIGGWRAYLREAQQPQAPAAAASEPAR